MHIYHYIAINKLNTFKIYCHELVYVYQNLKIKSILELNIDFSKSWILLIFFVMIFFEYNKKMFGLMTHYTLDISFSQTSFERFRENKKSTYTLLNNFV